MSEDIIKATIDKLFFASTTFLFATIFTTSLPVPCPTDPSVGATEGDGDNQPRQIRRVHRGQALHPERKDEKLNSLKITTSRQALGSQFKTIEQTPDQRHQDMNVSITVVLPGFVLISARLVFVLVGLPVRCQSASHIGNRT